MKVSRILAVRTLVQGCVLWAGNAWASGIPTASLEEVVVVGQLEQLVGASQSATQGLVREQQLQSRPIQRTGELLEVVPGLVVTQHSGSGKANQYFLRGFNLDHGTDLATSVDGVPINMPTHGHGQGYTDINFVIPELVQAIEYRKGTYYADTGNFAAAGAVDMRYRQDLDAPLVTLEVGENDFQRALVAASTEIGSGTLLMAMDHLTYDGPWRLAEDLRKVNGLARYTGDSRLGTFSITAQGYDGRWQSTDQIPLRAVESGTIDRYGYVDPTDGGNSHRYSLSLNAEGAAGSGSYSLVAYGIDYRLQLVSNFTYATDPLGGDQFEQLDDRRVYGANFDWSRGLNASGLEHELTLGVQTRHDDINAVGLYHTRARERLNPIREDAVAQSSYSLFGSLETRWSPVVRTVFGLRGEYFDFDVDSTVSANSGRVNDSLASPKFSLILGPWDETEYFLNIGRGFHSNDARGTTITVDPTDQVTPADRVDPLVAALGWDIGLRTAVLPKTQASVALWGLDLDSELLFVGDAGITEPNRASERRGVELGLIYAPLSWLIVDADLAWSRARFADADPAGDRIPGAVDRVASLGLAVDHPAGWFGGMRFRHFGSAPLIEDDSVRSSPTTLVNLEVGYRLGERIRTTLSVFNVFDRRDNDITYYYESQLAGESDPVADIHFHPVEPRTVRLGVTATF